MPPRSPGCASPVPSRYTHAVLLLALALLVGCADRSREPDFSGSPDDVPITVAVQNQHFNDVTIYVARDVQWQRLGNVTGNTNARFEIPEVLISPGSQFRFRIHAIGTSDDQDYVTDQVMVSRGAEVALRVAPVLRMSNWYVRQ